MNRLRSVAVVSLTMIVVFAFAIEARAQEKKITKKDVPQAVISAFEKAFPKAKVKSYSTETEDGKTVYEVESYQGRMTLDVSYLSDGTASEIEEGVTPGSLPEAVKVALKANYPGGKIARAERKTVGSDVTYEVRMTVGKNRVSVEIDASGKVVKKSKSGEEKEEKD